MDDLIPGFSQSGDSDGRWPLVLASPHSGRHYPPAFLASSKLSLAQLRRAEDAYVDELLDGVSGVPVLRARHGRAFLDLNRAADELDPGMFEAPLSVPAQRSDRVAAGLGVVPRVAAQGLEIYRRKLPAGEAAARLASIHRPWHERTAQLLDRARARHGYAILIDCHSMPTPAGVLPPQIVLGDRFGRSASPALMGLVERHFTGCGWRVARNAPYAGGHTTDFHGRPLEGIHAIQVEIDRALYLDSARMLRNTGFDRVAAAMAGMVRMVLAAAPVLGLAPGLREAAE